MQLRRLDGTPGATVELLRNGELHDRAVALPLKADRHRNGRHLSKVPVAVIPAFPLHEMRATFCCSIRHRALRTFLARRKPESLVEASRVVLPPRLHSITSSQVGKCCALVVSTTLELVRPRHALLCYPYLFLQLFAVAHLVYLPTMPRAENPPRGREH
jgi:hypothetical protein